MSGKNVFAVAAVLLCAGLPVSAVAESEESAGVVTTVNGNATLTRAAKRAQPVSLRMRDEIFVRDRIHTQQHSLVRVLLGGKALITVRELSVLTITEEANRVTVDLQSGKVGVAVVKGRMRPGEVIEIRSPNATASVRGTVFVVDVDPLPAGKSAGAAAATTRVHLFQGALDVSARHGGGQPPVRLAAMQTIVVAGNAVGGVRPLSREMVAALTADLKPRQVQDTEAAPSEFTGQVVAREQGRAIMLASTLLPAGPGGIPPLAPLKKVTGTVKGVTGAVTNITGSLTGGLEGTLTNVTDTAAETLERLMNTLGLGDGGDGLLAGAGDKTAPGLGNALGNVLGGGGSSSVSPGGASAGPGAPPMVTSVAPPVTTPAAPPIVTPVAPPILNPLTPIVNPIVNPILNLLGGKK
ncbi:MAG: FecR family protein [Candidatus Rokuibacteriota bacterium]